MKVEGKFYVTICKIISALPASTEDLYQLVDETPQTVLKWLVFLNSEGVVKPDGFTESHHKTYKLGDGRKWAISRSRKAPRALMSFVRVWDALHSRKSIKQISEASGVGEKTAAIIVRKMRAAGLARIGGYQVRHQTPQPLYDRLPLADAPWPQKLDRAEQQAKHWAKRSERLRAAGLSPRVNVPPELRLR